MSPEENNEKEYLKGLAPHLFSKEMDEKRSIPEGYFDSLEDKVLAKALAESGEAPQGKTRSLVNYRNLSIAAGLAVLLALIPFLKDIIHPVSTPESVSVNENLETVSEDVVLLYLAEEYDLESIAADLELDETNYSETEELSEEEILDYLMDSEMSESLIYESL
jgi:hypothetical protein